MEIITQPNDNANDIPLASLYEIAISEALELFIVTAFLTDWNPNSKINDKCKELSFIIGTDFGITRRSACRDVLKWLPKNMKGCFRAADRISGFHPKLIIWKNKKQECKLILGSSNLTRAAFSSNYEANIFSVISTDQYVKIKEWIYSIHDHCTPISEDWIEQYIESTRPESKKSGEKAPVVTLALPSGNNIDEAIRRRREQQNKFSIIATKLQGLIKRCADGRVTNLQFYEKMVDLWGNHDSRLQGRGFEIKGKHGDWRAVCSSLLAILSDSPALSVVELDNKVRTEIDLLASLDNPNRGAWLSEMLCHYFPEKYPLINKPVRVWLQYNKFKSPRGASEGAKYVDLSVKMRNALKNNSANTAKNLAELDYAIWQWYDDNR